MQKTYHKPSHRELTPEEELKLLHMEEKMKQADEQFPLLMKSHLETFNDGVIAIIITIMVLELPFPGGPGEYLHFLRSIGLFLVSFFIVADFWYDHHRIFQAVKGADHWIVVLDFLFLAALSLIPVMTKWILAERNSLSVLSYGIVNLTVIIFQGLLHVVALRTYFRGYEELFFYMTVRSSGPLLALAILLMVLGWYYPEIVMPCYLLIPLISFLRPRKRQFNWDNEVIRSVTRKDGQ